MTLLLNENHLDGLLSVGEVIAAVEEALACQQKGEVLSPMRMSLSGADRTLLAMPALTPVGAGVKVVSVVPANAATGLPVTLGIMILLDQVTGQPLCIIDAASLTKQRTGAVGAIGIKHIAPPDTDRIGIIGCGVQGTMQAIYASAVRPIRTAFVLEPSDSVYDRFVAQLAKVVPDLHVVRCWCADDVLGRVDVIITATTSAVPVLPDDRRLLAGKAFVSIGSFKPEMQELPDGVYALASTILVDSEHAIEEVGDLVNPLQKGLILPENIVPVGRLSSGEPRFHKGDTAVYKAVGDALFDVFVADAFYRKARQQGVGFPMDL
nr:ornithine cyclodeaminase family protein [Sphingomonas sp. Y57]